MWQILWMLTFVPDWIYQAILILGVLAVFAAYFLKFIPVVSAYSRALKITGIILTLIGVWFNGQMSADAKWRAKVADFEVRIAESERQAAEATGRIETVYVDRVQVVRDTQYIIQGQIREYSADLDANCQISPRAVEILNEAARNSVTGNKK
jgi:Zn-dependent protease with chaperone function